MTQEIRDYKGYQLHIGEITDNPNGRKTPAVLIYKDGQPVGGTYADIELESAVEKAIIKVDKYLTCKQFGCTMDQLNSQYKSNLETLKNMLIRATELHPKKYRGYTVAELQESIGRYTKLAKP